MDVYLIRAAARRWFSLRAPAGALPSLLPRRPNALPRPLEAVGVCAPAIYPYPHAFRSLRRHHSVSVPAGTHPLHSRLPTRGIYGQGSDVRYP
jgi:hypothetical protein